MKSFALLALAALPIALATDNRRHFYTTNPAGEMAKQGGYTNGGVTAYAFISQADGTVPMYVFVKATLGSPASQFAKGRLQVSLLQRPAGSSFLYYRFQLRGRCQLSC